jgi:Hg(II)-responsive transcriptional regulator
MLLSIGQVATAANVNVETIRYYERRGLLAEPDRTPSGYRQYADDAIARLRFIRHAQDIGFSLKEIEELLELRVRRPSACDAVHRRTRDKIALVDQRIRDLRRIKRVLDRLATDCANRRPTDECPILQALEDQNA